MAAIDADLDPDVATSILGRVGEKVANDLSGAETVRDHQRRVDDENRRRLQEEVDDRLEFEFKDRWEPTGL